MADDALQLEQFLCFSVYAAGHAFSRVYKPFLRELGLTYPQYLAMVALWQEDNQTVGQIGEKLFMETSTLTPLLKRLESGGYVRRSRDTADERVVRIALTDQGRALRDKAAKVPLGILHAMGQDAGKLKAIQADLTLLRDTLIENAAE
ncbi:MarR family transcriptional regulator [Roseomonas sp. E05]|uniref:MarR family winged helix-turn-helix transcriptional regulator n=1 Tax=Roseomonas sp. E05 TaxID=3046310 RepID=UPI0024BB8292|nr:MarR family transcriptional regulator [Roseomonas sp. E05]MDJ0390938.1 MarR family transcriptional regulator [Roseomonas sp. E05]